MNKKEYLPLVLILVLIIFPFLFLGIKYWQKHSFRTRFIHEVKQNYHNPNHKIILKDLTSFSWDYVEWIYHGDSYGSPPISIGNVFYFYSKEKLIAEINLKERFPQLGSYLNCGCPQTPFYQELCFTPETAVFKIGGNRSEPILKATKCDSTTLN